MNCYICCTTLSYSQQQEGSLRALHPLHVSSIPRAALDPHAYGLRAAPVSLRGTLPLRMAGLPPSTHEEQELMGPWQH